MATEAAILSNSVLHHVWTFASLDVTGSLLVRFAKYNVLALSGLVPAVLTLFLLSTTWRLHYLVANLPAIEARDYLELSVEPALDLDHCPHGGCRPAPAATNRTLIRS